MPTQPQAKKPSEVNDPSLEEGTDEVITMVKKMLKEKEFIALALNGPGCDEAKKELSGKLYAYLSEAEIPVITPSDPHSLTTYAERFRERQESMSHKGGVIIFDGYDAGAVTTDNAEGHRSFLNSTVSQYAQEAGIPLEAIDLWIGFYNVGAVFWNVDENETPIADVLIRIEDK